MSIDFATAHLKPADDLRHRFADGVKTRDSLFWNLILPEEQVAAQIYAFSDGRGFGGRQMIVYQPDPDALVMHNTLGHDLGADSDFDDWSCEGMRVRQPEPLRVAKVDYTSEEVSMEYTFTGTHRPFAYSENDEGCPQWMAANRYEQTGRASGTLRIGDREIAFDDVWVHRDHSWGRRHWSFPHHWKWLCAGTPSGAELNAMLHIAKGEYGVNGYVVRNGEPVPLVDARSKATYQDDMTQSHLDCTLIDAGGGTTHLEMERFAVFQMRFGTDSLITEAACRVRIDGEDGTGQFETLFPRGYAERLVNAE